ncbi:MAG TPA: dihydrofolate reductase family protein [Puia sp.]|jgi:dihydrofolate reductase
MRNLIFAINLTIDGCADHTKGIVNAEILEYYTNLLGDADTFVYGRKTYQLMVPYWPDVAKDPAGQTKEDVDYARAFVSIDKMVVVSRTLDKAEGKNTRIIRSDLKDEILKLKGEPGRNILTGGVEIPAQLMQLGLIDEYRVVIHPTIAGEGRRLWEGVGLPESLLLKLVDTRIFQSGSVALRYVKK